MTGTATVTGKIGADQTATAVVLSDVKRIDYQLSAGVVQITYGGSNKIATFELSNMVTITMTIAGTALTATLTT